MHTVLIANYADMDSSDIWNNCTLGEMEWKTED